MTDAPFVVADIGATHARFQLADARGLLDSPVVLTTSDFSDGRDLLAAARDLLGTGRVSAALLAVAGPKRAGQDDIVVTNTGLTLSPAQGDSTLGTSLRLVNDFFALAHAVPHVHNLRQFGGDEPAAGVKEVKGVKGVLGPGTGLGMAVLLPRGASAWQVLASEGGHADLAIGNHLDAELWSILQQHHPHVCWETVLCGSGMVHLYQAVCTLWGGDPQDLTPADISERGMLVSDPICHQTLDTFCGLLGAAAGNLALTVGALGGIYIAGGITPRIVDFFAGSPLRRRFEERGEMTPYVASIPLLAILDEQPGLLGAYYCLQQQLGSTNS